MRDTTREVYILASSAGSIKLNNTNGNSQALWFHLPGSTGLDIIPTENTTLTGAGTGSLWISQRLKHRPILLKTILKASNTDEYHTQLTQLRNILRGDNLQLQTVRDNKTYYLELFYESGAEGNYSFSFYSQAGFTCAFDLAFTAPNPYWQADTKINVDLNIQADYYGFLPSLANIKLNNTTQAGGAVLTSIESDVSIAPSYTLYGPMGIGSSFTLNGQGWELAQALEKGDIFKITNRWGRSPLQELNGVETYGLLKSVAYFPSFSIGVNNIEVNIVDGLFYEPQYSNDVFTAYNLATNPNCQKSDSGDLMVMYGEYQQNYGICAAEDGTGGAGYLISDFKESAVLSQFWDLDKNASVVLTPFVYNSIDDIAEPITYSNTVYYYPEAVGSYGVNIRTGIDGIYETGNIESWGSGFAPSFNGFEYTVYDNDEETIEAKKNDDDYNADGYSFTEMYTLMPGITVQVDFYISQKYITLTTPVIISYSVTYTFNPDEMETGVVPVSYYIQATFGGAQLIDNACYNSIQFYDDAGKIVKAYCSTDPVLVNCQIPRNAYYAYCSIYWEGIGAYLLKHGVYTLEAIPSNKWNGSSGEAYKWLGDANNSVSAERAIENVRLDYTNMQLTYQEHKEVLP